MDKMIGTFIDKNGIVHILHPMIDRGELCTDPVNCFYNSGFWKGDVDVLTCPKCIDMIDKIHTNEIINELQKDI